MRTRSFWPWPIAAISLLVMSLALGSREPTSSHPSSLQPSPVAQGVAEPVKGLLEEKVIELIAAKVIEGLAAKSRDSPRLSANSTVTADSLKRELAAYKNQVQALSKHTKDLAVYTKEIEHSLSIIDTRLSTPRILKEKLEQQQNRSRP
jgi:hypothetical protein